MIFTSQKSRANYYSLLKPEFFRDIILGGGFPYQLMVNWCSGLVVWIPLGSPKLKGIVASGVPRFEGPKPLIYHQLT